MTLDTVRAVVVESLDHGAQWVSLAASDLIWTIDAEHELFVSVLDFDLALTIARQHDRRLAGVEPALVRHRVVPHPTLGTEVFTADETCWTAAAAVVRQWPSDPDLVVAASFETAEDVRSRS